MGKKFSKKQLAAQRKFARAAKARARAARKARSGARKASKKVQRAKVRVHKQKRSGNMGKKKGGIRRYARKLTFWKVAEKVADANAIIQVAEPVIRRAAPAVMAGDLQGALQGAKEGAKEAVTPRNLVEAAAPSLTVRLLRKGAAMLKRI